MVKTLVRGSLARVARMRTIQRIIHEELDLSCLKRRPTRCEQCGILLVLFSYVMGWPAVVFFGFLAGYFKQPLVLVIGGPLVYGTSHLVFFVGAYLAGKTYTKTFIKWSLKKACEKMFAETDQNLPADIVKAK